MKILKVIGLLLLVICTSSHLNAQQKKIVILHTNDTHSQIEPLPANDRSNPSMGGILNRFAKIDSIRNIYEHVLLLDAGDIVQGTPYYNVFNGRAEIEAMNQLGYDVGTIGNHEFDKGLDTLAMMYKKAKFPIVCCNYDFSNTPLKNLVKPYVIIKRNGLKIGIFGIGVQPEGLIQKDKYEGMVYLPDVEAANKYAHLLKEEKKCDLVICLTHIGYKNDLKLVEQTRNIDLLIGGHSHTFLEKETRPMNMDGKEVPVAQVGKSGVFLGMFEITIP